jgi:hypothetical protein
VRGGRNYDPPHDNSLPPIRRRPPNLREAKMIEPAAMESIAATPQTALD